jgi:alpha-1,3-mannosylglycoprotein beta-1,4-N-acetylglucosaminyltransferase A/B
MLRNVCRLKFQSGNSEHPGDKFFNTSVEVLLTNHNSLSGDVYHYGNASYSRTSDGYLVVCWFDHVTGLAEASLNLPQEVEMVRLHVHFDSESWVILNEVSVLIVTYAVVQY